jgi:long-chain acyl-CoA synthetase
MPSPSQAPRAETQRAETQRAETQRAETQRAETQRAEIHWSAGDRDHRALALRRDWSGLRGLDELWPELDRLYGDSPALEAPHARQPETLSYRQLHQAIRTAAAGFASLGVGPGDVVALFSENGPRWLVADQGLMAAGAADAVRGSAAPPEELRYILADSGAVALVVETPALLERLALAADQAGSLRFVLLLEGEPQPGCGGLPPTVPCLAWQELLDRGGQAPPPPAPAADDQRLATILYTSGTTGQPKGVPLSHANLLHQLRHLGVAVAPAAGDRVVSVLPIWHSYERTAEYFLLSCGCRQTYTTLKQLRPDLQRVRPQYLISVPRLWEALLGGFEDAMATMPANRRRLLALALANSRAHFRARRTALDLTLSHEPLPRRLVAALEATLRWPLHRLAEALLWPQVRQQLLGGRLRTAISGGGALAIHVDGFFEAIGLELLVGYGLTETSPVLTCRRRWCNRRGSAGQPLPGTAIRIVDPESGAVLGLGERGLVMARGPQVMAGYFHKPSATARVLAADGWFDTGDLGHLLADGSLVLTGRAKDTIVLSSGENIEPGPLEEALAECPLLEQVMVVGQDRKQLGALVVPKTEILLAWAAGQPGAKAAARSDDPAVLRALKGELNRRLAARSGSRPDERLAGVALVEPFTIDNGLLTQTLKQRRDRITARDGAAIEAIYRGG